MLGVDVVKGKGEDVGNIGRVEGKAFLNRVSKVINLAHAGHPQVSPLIV